MSQPTGEGASVMRNHSSKVFVFLAGVLVGIAAIAVWSGRPIEQPAAAQAPKDPSTGKFSISAFVVDKVTMGYVLDTQTGDLWFLNGRSDPIAMPLKK
jgi:hypothetical protein